MSENPNVRKAQVRVQNEWRDVYPQSIKRNDLFRMFEPDGTPIIFPDGSTTQFALEDAYVNKNGIVTVAYGALIKF
jgi:hypothetical protein